MNTLDGKEYEALRREIEVRLQRETEYSLARLKYLTDTSPWGLTMDKYLADLIEKNNAGIELIGKFLLENGSEWEKYLKDNLNK